MVGFYSREKWKNTTELLGALLLGCICITTLGSGYGQPPGKQHECSPGDYRNKNGTCCNMCNPGSKFVAPCVADGHRTKCAPCPAGQYTENINYTPNCRSCTRCKEFEEEVSKCRKDRNRVCGCKEGFYKDVIDSETSQCLKCSKCDQPGERQSGKCQPDHDTECECEKDFYRMNDKCLPCNNCKGDCQLHCPSSTTSPKDKDVTIVVAIGSCVLVVLLVGFITYKTTKRHTKSKMGASTAPGAVPQDATKVLIHSEEFSYKEDNMALPCILVGKQELTRLPDCIPLEINIPGLIYAVLNLVPATRVKELVRGLGVTDVEIEQAAMDHHTCKEAHYQMLRVWAERESRGGGAGRRGGVLHRPRMQELLDRLRDMHLGGPVEELETKYGIEGGQVGAA